MRFVRECCRILVATLTRNGQDVLVKAEIPHGSGSENGLGERRDGKNRFRIRIGQTERRQRATRSKRLKRW
jgi:hypothetical protein